MQGTSQSCQTVGDPAAYSELAQKMTKSSRAAGPQTQTPRVQHVGREAVQGGAGTSGGKLSPLWTEHPRAPQGLAGAGGRLGRGPGGTGEERAEGMKRALLGGQGAGQRLPWVEDGPCGACSLL